MEVERGTDHENSKANSILKKLERILSMNKRGAAKSSSKGGSTTATVLTKSRSWHSTTKKKVKHHQTAPNGCFSVYVGPEKQRFIIKTEFANHRLFKMLLDDAELEYGFKREGPLLLPCAVDLFCKVLAEMDGGDRESDDYDDDYYYGCCSPFSPARRLGRSTTSYGLLTPPRLLKINNF